MIVGLGYLSSFSDHCDDTGGHPGGAAMTGDKRDVEAYVRALAFEHGVTLEQDAYAKMAQVLTNLCGDDVQLDQVEQLLVGLKRKSVIDGKEMLLLQAGYLRSKSS